MAKKQKVDGRTITAEEREQIDTANASGKKPVVFVHGLWLLPSNLGPVGRASSQRPAGYCTLSPGWPDDPDTVEQAKEHPEVFARKSIGDIADHYEAIIRGLDKKPAIIGHSFGGLLTQILAGRALAAASVAIDPAPFRGVLPLPISALTGRRRPCSKNPGQPPSPCRSPTTSSTTRSRTSRCPEDEAKALYDEFAVPGSGEPLSQAAAANFKLRGSRPRSTARTRSAARA